MKAGGVKFADTPEEAAAHAEEILELEINGHMPRGVLVDPKAEVKQEYYAGVVWDGIRKRPGDALQRHGRDRHRGGRRAAPRARRPRAPLEPPRGAGLPREGGRRRRPASPAASCTRITPILARLARLFSEYDMTLAEINPLGELEDGSFVALDAHMEMENEARPRQKALLAGARRRRRGDARGARGDRRSRSRGEQVDAMDHRGVAGQRDRVRRQPRPRDRRRRRLADARSTRSASTAASPPTTARSAATRRSRRRPASPSWCSPSRASTRSR